MVGIDLNGKRVDLALLSTELTAAGVAYNGLGTSGDGADVLLLTYDAEGEPLDLPPEAVPVVEAHVAPPLVIEYRETRTVDAIVRTTDATVHEVFRFPCDQHRRYRASLVISGVDAGNWVSLDQEGRFVWKRVTGNTLAPGITVVSQIPPTIPAGWATNCLASGTAIVFTVQGPAGRTIDWKLEGTVEVYAPGGL